MRGGREVQPFDMIPRAYSGGKTFKNSLDVGVGADAPPLLNASTRSVFYSRYVSFYRVCSGAA